MRFSASAAALAMATTVSAHAQVYGLWVNGKDQGDGRNVCGSNCKHDSASKQAFEGAQRRVCQESYTIICPICTFRSIAGEKGINVVDVCDAELVMGMQELRGLRLMSATGARYSRCIEKMLAQGYRRAEPMVEIDNLAELVRQNPGILAGAEEILGLQVTMDGVCVVTGAREEGVEEGEGSSPT